MPIRPYHHALQRFATVSATLLVVFSSALALQSWQETKTDELTKLRTVLALALRSADRYLLQQQQAMAGLAQDLPSGRSAAELAQAQRLLAQFQARHGELIAVNLLDLNGQFLASSSTTALSGLPTAGPLRDFPAIVARLLPAAPLALGRPLVGPLSQRWILPMGYAVHDRNGAPTQIIVAAVPVEMLQGFWSDAPALSRTSIGLVNDDGYLLSRFPLPPGTDLQAVYGQRRSGAVQQHLDTWQHPHSGQVTGQNLLADAPQISVFQRLDQLPATLVVDMPLAELRAAWWRRVRMPLLLAGVLAVAGALAYRRLRRSQQAWDAERVAASNALGSALVQLTRSEERLLAELNEQTDVICRLSADNRVLFVNDAYCRVFNLQRSEHVGGSWHSVALAEDIPAIERQLASLSPANPIVTVDNRVHTAAGVRWFQWINRAQFDAQGRLLTIQGVGRDIDERKALEAALAHNVQDLHRAQQQATELLREQAALLDNELIGIVKLKHRRFEWANRGMARIFGHDPAALVGQSTRLVFCDDASFERMGRSYDQLRNGQPVRVQLQMAHRDGRAVWIDGSGVALNAEGSEALWLMADIDQLKQAEALRLRAGALVAETRQMQQSNQLRTLFLANMSHELRTPLNAVIGFAQLLQGGRVTPDSPQYPGYVNRIASSGQHLLRLIDAVLDVVKLESGQMSFHATPVNLPVLLAEVQQMLAGDISARQVTVVVDTDNAPTDLVADPWRLQQVVFEYLANAVKFSHPGGWVSVNVQAEGRAQLRIEVADSGPGISEADRARLFTDFQQLGTGLNKPHPGLGLGLSLVRRLVEAQGGSVGVRSLPGQGSVFHVVLPLRPRVMTEPDGPGDGAPASPA